MIRVKERRKLRVGVRQCIAAEFGGKYLTVPPVAQPTGWGAPETTLTISRLRLLIISSYVHICLAA